MKENKYSPEGIFCNMQVGHNRLWSGGMGKEMLEKAMLTDKIMEAYAIRCDKDHNLIVDLGDVRGIIPREETVLGIETGEVKDIAIISRVNRLVCFKVISVVEEEGKTVAYLSRKQAQRECLSYYLEHLKAGDILPGVVTHLEPFGCFVDIGCGIVSLINIENISVSRISHPKDRFAVGQRVRVVVKNIDKEQQRIYVSHKELLGTWDENVESFSMGETVAGTVRSIEDYGVFVELAPNLAGLCEYRSDVSIGQSVSVYIKNIIPERMKIKMLIIGSFEQAQQGKPVMYYEKKNHIDRWVYTPKVCSFKHIETVFEER